MGFDLSVYNATTIFMILPLFTLGTMHRDPTSESLFSSGNTLLLSFPWKWESILYYLFWVYAIRFSMGRYNIYPYMLLYITIFFTLPVYPHAISNTNLFWILIPGFWLLFSSRDTRYAIRDTIFIPDLKRPEVLEIRYLRLSYPFLL